MYNKLFSKILDSSIWLEPDPTRIVWVTLLAAMDEDGFCAFACAANVANRARVPLEAAEEALRILESPDPHSADPDDAGRRIERVPGGWIVLNAVKYAQLATREKVKESTRRRVQAFRERQRNAPVTPCNVPVTPSDTDTDTNTIESNPLVESEKAFDQGELESGNSIAATEDFKLSPPERENRDLEAALVEQFAYYVEQLHRSPTQYELTPERKKKGLARLKECIAHTKDRRLESGVQLMRIAIDRLAESPHHNGENRDGTRYVEWETHLLRKDWHRFYSFWLDDQKWTRETEEAC